MAETAATTDEAREKALRQAYGKATQQLREAHRDEFNDLYSKAASDAGYEWKPKPKAEDKAREQMQSLLAEFPHLADELAQGSSPAEPDTTVEKGL